MNEVKKEILKITNLATTAAVNGKINEVKNKIPNITNLAATTALTAVEKKIPDVSNLVKKTDYNTKINKIENKITTDHDHDKHITTQELRSKIFSSKLAELNVTSKNELANFVKKTDFVDKILNLNKNVTLNKT